MDLSLNSLSVEAIRKDQEGLKEEKLRSQAANNVFRQKSAQELRGEKPSSKPASSSKAPSPPTRTPKEKTPDEEAKELADLIEKVTAFKSNPVLAPKLISIAMPRNGTIAEYRLCYEQIKNRLAQGMAGHSIRQTYLQGMAFAVPFLESDRVSESIRLPQNSYQYLSGAVAQGRFDPEFEELAIEFSKFFRSGPIPRLIFGTFSALMEYKALVGAGFIDPRTGVPTAEMQAAMSEAQQQPQPQPQVPVQPSYPPPLQAPQPEVAQPEIIHPPPMRLYPEPVQEVHAQIEQDSFAPEFGMPSISSRESLPLDDGIGVGFIDDPPMPKKKSSRGRRV